MTSGFALDPMDAGFTVLATLVALFGAASFVALGLIGYAIDIALEAFFNR